MTHVINIFSQQLREQKIYAPRYLALFLLVFCFSASSNSLAATLSGTVLGNGAPLDATVRVYGGSVDTSVSTDSAGAYSVLGLSIGVTYSLDITPASPSSLKPLIGYSVAINSENESESFNLIQEYGSFNISGTVQTDEGYPVSTGMRLWASQCCEYTSSSSSGAYQISDVREGTDYQLSTYADQATIYRSGLNAVLVQGDNRNTKTFDLSQDTTLDFTLDVIYVEGIVTDENGTPIQGASVQGLKNYFRGTTTDSQGRYALAFYSSQTSTRIKVIPPNDTYEYKEFSLELSAQNIDLNIQLRELEQFNISGTVQTDEGYPVSTGMRLWASQCCEYTSSSSSGAYQISDVREGTDYQLSTYADQATIYRSGLNAVLVQGDNRNTKTFDLSQDTTLDFTLDVIYVEGIVTDENGTPIQGASVQGLKNYFRGTTTDSQGRYALAFYSSQTSTRIKVIPPNDTYEYKEFSLELSAQNIDLNIQLRELEQFNISGTVQTDEGYPVSTGMRLWASQCCEYTSSSSSGAYQISDVREGTDYQLSTYADQATIYRSGLNAVLVQGDNRNTKTFDLSQDTTLDFTLDVIYVEGTVTDINLVPIEGASVQGLKNYFRGTTTDSQGRYALAFYSSQTSTVLKVQPNFAGLNAIDDTSLSLDGSDKGFNFVLGNTDSTNPNFTAPPLLMSSTINSASIAWQTDEPTRSVVSGTGFPNVSNGDYRVNHEVTLTGLSPSTAYTATVAITDRSGNGPVEATVSFTTPAAPDVTPPVITSGPIIASTTVRSMVVQWSTNEPAVTVLKWGAGGTGNTAQPDSVYRTDHEVTLTGLSELTDYQVQASATDIEGNGPTLSSIVTVKTLASPDTTAPEIISGPFISNISDTEATVSWATNEPAVSGVSLNDGTAYLVYRDENLVTEHEVRLTGLSANTTYYYTVSSTDEAGNGPTLSSEDTFRTLSAGDTTPPEIVEGLKIVGITHQSAVVQFKTDEPASIQVRYGSNANALDQFTTDIELSTNHVAQLTDLASDTTYYVEVTVTDSAGNAATLSGGEFTTLALPVGEGPKFLGPPTVLVSGDGRALVKWETDEAAECYITYQTSGASEQLRVDVPGKRTRHQVMLTDLEVDAIYNYAITCRNDAGFSTTYASEQQARMSSGAAMSGSFRVSAETQVRAQISSASIVHSTADRLVLRVQTDKPTTIEARYGASDNNIRQSLASPRYETDHLLVLTNLQASTAHNIAIKVRDISGTVTQSSLANQMTASSLDTTAPGISGSPTLRTTTANQISVSFTGSEYAVSEVACASTSNGGTWTAGSETLKTQHALLLKGLKSQATYRCRIKQVDTSGNASNSSYYTVSLGSGTPEQAPSKPVITKTDYEEGKIILYVSVASSGDSSLDIYTASCDDGTRVITTTSTGSPITITGLDSNKSYTCSVTATNANGYVSESSKETGSITPEELPSGLPIWLLYEASKS